MSAEEWTVVTDGLIIDGTGAPPRVGTVAACNGRLTAVGDFDDKAIPRDADFTRVDGTGKTVMPGLIDAHCHMTYGESRTEEEIDLYTSAEGRTLRAAWNAAKVLRAGVTSISQPGGSYFIGVGLRDAIAEGFVQGPRMAAAGRYLTTSNGLTDWYPDSVGVPEGSIGILTNTMPQMIDEIRRQVKAGVDFIKIADSPLGEYQAFTNDELKALADLAHQLGKRITIHARGSAEVRAAVDAGFDWIMHGNAMSDDTIEALAESRIPLIPTLTLLANSTDYGKQIGVPTGLYEAWARLMDASAETLHRAHDAGVVFGAGTDSGFALTPYGEWHAHELTLLVDYACADPNGSHPSGHTQCRDHRPHQRHTRNTRTRRTCRRDRRQRRPPSRHHSPRAPQEHRSSDQQGQPRGLRRRRASQALATRAGDRLLRGRPLLPALQPEKTPRTRL